VILSLFKATSHPKDREMKNSEIKMVFIAARVNSIHQLPEQVDTEKIEEKYRC
jgi:hypothetical protein